MKRTDIAADALALVRRIEVLSGRGGWADTDALRDVTRLIDQLRSAALTNTAPAYWGEKLGNVATWAGILFSARKHARWGGFERVRHLLLCDCARLRLVLRPDAARDRVADVADA